MAINRLEQLRVYQQAFEAAMLIFEQSKQWPKEERYALTDQIRRSSRSVCANIAEAWRKRRYSKHFISKLTDADSEVAETRVWLRFAHRSGYLDEATYHDLNQSYNAICGGLVNMITASDKWCGPSNLVREDATNYHATS